jgi:hypothetical protein
MKMHGLHGMQEIEFFKDRDLNEIIIWLEEARQKTRHEDQIRSQGEQISSLTSQLKCMDPEVICQL